MQVMIFAGSQSVSVQNSNPNSGTPTALSTAQIELRRSDSTSDTDTVGIQITGTYTGTLTPQVSIDGSNWITMGGAPLINAQTGVSSTGIVATAGMWQVDVAGFRYFRLSMNTAASGAAVISLVGVDSTGVVGLDTPLPPGANAIGSVSMTANATPGTTSVAVNSAATTNAAVSKASGGVVTNLQANNTTAAPKYIRLYNKATAPVPGTDVPVIVITVPVSSSKEVAFGTLGKRFASGIGHSITNGAGALDATAVAAGDVQLTYDYA